MSEFDDSLVPAPIVLEGQVVGGDKDGWTVLVKPEMRGEGWHLFFYEPGDLWATYDAFADEWSDVFELGERESVRWFGEPAD